MPTSSITNWPALEAEVLRLASLVAEQKRLNAIIDTATAAVLTAHEKDLRRLSDLGAVDAAIRSNVELFCKEHHDEIVTPDAKTRDLAGGATVAFALDPPSVAVSKKSTLAKVCLAICRRGRELLGFLKKPKPDLDRNFILKFHKEAKDPKAAEKQLAALGIEIKQAERFELKLAGE